jgi:hypothetical protein
VKQRISLSVSAAALWLCGAAAGHAATLPQRQPGLWQSTTTVTGPDGQTLPGGNNVVSVSCVDPATDIKFFVIGAGQCSKLMIGGTGPYTIDGTCPQNGKPATIHETLVYEDAQTVVLNAVLNGGGGPITVNSALKYQGDCLPGMVPGDEGSIDNGMFTKTDNVNDTDNQ